MEEVAALPEAMIELGYKLVTYPDGTMVAVSTSWGCSARSTDLAEVIRSARNIYGFIEFMKRKIEEDRIKFEEYEANKNAS